MWFSNSRVKNVVFQLQSQKEHLSNLNPKTVQMHNLTPSPLLLLPYPFFLSKRKGQGSFSINTNVIKSFGITNFRLTLFNEIGIFVLNQYLYMYIFNNGFFVCYVVLCLKNSFQLYE